MVVKISLLALRHLCDVPVNSLTLNKSRSRQLLHSLNIETNILGLSLVTETETARFIVLVAILRLSQSWSQDLDPNR